MAKTIDRVIPAEGVSLIERKANLVCPKGHRAYSPEPMAWVESQCNHRADGKGARCAQKLALLRNSRDIPAPKKKSKLRKMKRF